MKTQFCKLKTMIDDSSFLMIHTVSPTESVIADFETGIIIHRKDGKTINKVQFGNMRVGDYENYLAGITRTVETTKNL